MTFDVKVGDEFAIDRQITDDLVRAFAELSGDHNPIHLDEEFAKRTRFGRRIAHGHGDLRDHPRRAPVLPAV